MPPPGDVTFAYAPTTNLKGSKCPTFWVVDVCPSATGRKHRIVHTEPTCKEVPCAGPEAQHLPVPPENSQYNPIPSHHFQNKKSLCFNCRAEQKAPYWVHPAMTENTLARQQNIRNNPDLSEEDRENEVAKLRAEALRRVKIDLVKKGEGPDSYGR